ncbi:hypothetical protein Plim_3339 [Planctopirus limnophila DSM 3776]|uniref:Uncharacterized protein n=2 Tax=Planctopirus limnophila TaxID=120 RepID=D5SU99_PLAL2|nr:hypothetical protein Plim_3339 [Planctopirus limnophila DSM 3776]
MTCRQLQSDLSQMLDSVEITWWAPEDLWDEARLKAGQIHLLDGRKDAARFVEHSTAYQIVVDVTPWLSHPLAKQLATWINPDLDPQLSEEQSSPLGLLRRMSIALSGPSAIPGHLDRLKWQGAATLAHFWGPLEKVAAVNIQTAMTPEVLASNQHLIVWTISTLRQIITLEVATGLPPRAWCEAVGPAGSLVVDGFLDPSLAAKPRFWVHDARGIPRAEEFSPASEVELFAQDLRLAQHDSALREHWRMRIQRTSQWLEILEKSATESTLSRFLR